MYVESRVSLGISQARSPAEGLQPSQGNQSAHRRVTIGFVRMIAAANFARERGVPYLGKR